MALLCAFRLCFHFKGVTVCALGTFPYDAPSAGISFPSVVQVDTAIVRTAMIGRKRVV